MCKFSIEPGRKKVQKWMKENNYSYNDIAKLCGRNKQTVYQYITGVKSNGKGAAEFIKDVMDVFGIE